MDEYTDEQFRAINRAENAAREAVSKGLVDLAHEVCPAMGPFMLSAWRAAKACDEFLLLFSESTYLMNNEPAIAKRLLTALLNIKDAEGWLNGGPSMRGFSAAIESYGVAVSVLASGKEG